MPDVCGHERLSDQDVRLHKTLKRLPQIEASSLVMSMKSFSPGLRFAAAGLSDEDDHQRQGPDEEGRPGIRRCSEDTKTAQRSKIRAR